MLGELYLKQTKRKQTGEIDHAGLPLMDFSVLSAAMALLRPGMEYSSLFQMFASEGKVEQLSRRILKEKERLATAVIPGE